MKLNQLDGDDSYSIISLLLNQHRAETYEDIRYDIQKSKIEDERQTMVDKTLHRKQKIEQNEATNYWWLTPLITGD